MGCKCGHEFTDHPVKEPEWSRPCIYAECHCEGYEEADPIVAENETLPSQMEPEPKVE